MMTGDFFKSHRNAVPICLVCLRIERRDVYVTDVASHVHVTH